MNILHCEATLRNRNFSQVKLAGHEPTAVPHRYLKQTNQDTEQAQRRARLVDNGDFYSNISRNGTLDFEHSIITNDITNTRSNLAGLHYPTFINSLVIIWYQKGKSVKYRCQHLDYGVNRFSFYLIITGKRLKNVLAPVRSRAHNARP